MPQHDSADHLGAQVDAHEGAPGFNPVSWSRRSHGSSAAVAEGFQGGADLFVELDVGALD